MDEARAVVVDRAGSEVDLGALVRRRAAELSLGAGGEVELVDLGLTCRVQMTASERSV
jgi:hypothetical protein